MDDELTAQFAHFKALKDLKEKTAEELKQINIDLQAEGAKLLKMMQARDLQNAKVSGLGTFFQAPVCYVSVDDRAAALAWLRANDKGDLIKEDVNTRTLQSFVKERLEQNLEVPDGIKAFIGAEVRLRK